MNKNFIKKMKSRLLQERASIIEKISSEDHKIDCDGDEADEVQANLIIYLTDQMSSRHNLSLSKIAAALDKIEKDEYGYCESCDNPILEKRLEFNPYFTECISCAEKKERSLRK